MVKAERRQGWRGWAQVGTYVAVIMLFLAVGGIIIDRERWAQATDGKIEALVVALEINSEQDKRSKEHINYLLKCETAAAAKNSTLETKMDNVTSVIDKLDSKIENVNTKIERMMILFIKEIQTRHNNGTD